MSESQSATFPASPASPRAARSFVRRMLPGVSEAEIPDVIMLLVSEVVTNAVVHARSGVRVQVVVDDHRVRVEVDDDAPELPVQRQASEEALGGRGLLLLERLSDRWGVDARSSGKTVWFEIGGVGGPSTRMRPSASDALGLSIPLEALSSWSTNSGARINGSSPRLEMANLQDN